ncbi:MAG TPA: phosphoribosylamine--glycine ligase [Streptosporangiaceae bacterium]|nr:phosphoribosylamine--glycine ligase [Streptosporangiaceae bacterium]
MRVLVIGSGGREHAIVRALAQDPAVTSLHAAPGNPGIAALAHTHPVAVSDPAAIAALARQLDAGLVVIGPEVPLVAGAADAVRAAGIACFGPGAGAAMIEGSKAFAKQVMAEGGIPTAAARTCTTPAEADAALAEFGPPYVVKEDGLAAGKGVLVTEDLELARAHAQAAARVVIEEFLDGPEVSLFAVCDGHTGVPLLPAQDFKRAHDGDRGPNTGGMGSYAPLPWAPAGLADEVMATVVQPAVDTLARRGTPYQGLLYAGLALTAAGIRVIEFNARFGDPETQVVLDRMETPLAGLLHAAATGGLAGPDGPAALRWRPGAAVTVVLAAQGYPERPVTGDVITGLEQAERVPDAYVLQAGTTVDADGVLRANGGRVLNVIGTGGNIEAARSAAYQAAGEIHFRGGWYRRDIAAPQRQPGAGQPGRGVRT